MSIVPHHDIITPEGWLQAVPDADLTPERCSAEERIQAVDVQLFHLRVVHDCPCCREYDTDLQILAVEHLINLPNSSATFTFLARRPDRQRGITPSMELQLQDALEFTYSALGEAIITTDRDDDTLTPASCWSISWQLGLPHRRN